MTGHSWFHSLTAQRANRRRHRQKRRSYLDLASLESRELPSTTLQFDFGTATSPVASKYQKVTDTTVYQPSRGYGWLSGQIGSTDLGPGTYPAKVFRDFDYTANGAFGVDLPNGTYTVTLMVGDATAGHDQMGVFFEGQLVDTLTVQANQFITPSYTVTVADGQLTLGLRDFGGSDPYAIINGLRITKAGASAAPLQAAFSGGVANEGSTGQVSFSNVTGGSGAYTYSYDFNNDGVFEITNSTSPTATVPASYLADGPGFQTVHGRVTDSSGATADYTTTISILNVPPSVQLSAPSTGAAGVALNFAATVTDPSPVDTAAGFTYAWNFGDGSTSTQAAPSHAYAAAGTYTVKLTATDKDGGATTASATVTVSPAAPVGPTAAFDWADPSTQGSWQGTYGARGYSLAGDATQAPAFAQVAFSGQSNYTWASPTADPSALQSASNPATRLAACWYGASFSVDVNLTDGKTHAVALYLLDWGGSSRSERVDVLNAGTGQVLDTRTVSAFSGGTYLSWDLAGHVQFRITCLTGPNAVLSGLFFADPAPFIFSNSGPVNEGSTATVTLTNRSGSGSYTYSYDFNNDGVFEITNSTSPTATVPASYLADGPGTRVVRARVTDSSGAFSDYTTAIQINNVAPTPNPGGPYSGAAGSAIAFTASATDPSPVDTAAGFTFTWNFGDGTTGSGQAVTHTYANTGTYAVTVTATDKDGGATSATTSATVAPPDHIVTPYDNIPDFGAHPTVTAVKSGLWSDPTTWSTGNLPGAGDVVSIRAGTAVTYDLVSNVPVKTVAIQAGGSLLFRTDVSTRLTVVNLLVKDGGLLQIGTAANPVAANVKAEVVFPDVPLDTVNDPSQYGNGLIALGKVSIYGAAMNQTFAQLAVEPVAGATTLTLAQPVTGWRVGDRLILPDTREFYYDIAPTNPNSGYVSNREIVTVASISPDGLTLSLTQPLQFDHRGARDANGNLKLLPQVADLTRNVVIHSANPNGVRGHTLFTGHADVDIHYAQFSGLGRTRVDQVDNTTFNADGSVAHVGTNQTARYSVNFRDLVGPAGGQSDGYQFTFQGNSVFCPLDPMPYRWGIDLHGSSYGLVQDNVLYNWAGAGIMADVGNETGNVIAHNFVTRITGNNARPDSRGGVDMGFEGWAYWFRGFNNVVRDNVAADVVGGYMFYADGLAPVSVPAGPGADPSVPGQATQVNMNDTPIAAFSGCSAYGVQDGIEIWGLGTYGVNPYPDARESVVSNFTAWHVTDKAYYNYETSHLTFDGFTFYGDINTLLHNGGATAFFSGDYVQNNFVLRNANIQDAKIGIMPATESGGGTQTYENCYLRNYFNFVEDHIYRYGNQPTPGLARTVILRNDQFASANVPDLGDWRGPPSNIVMLDYQNADAVNFIQSDRVLVYAYNGNSSDNFQVFYNGQAANAILPTQVLNSDGTVRVAGSPVAGLTNAQTWAQYGIAVGGAVAPGSATQRAGIIGLVNPI
jgi:PKD repeat protein